MKKFLKIAAVVVGCFILLGILLPDPKKEGGTAAVAKEASADASEAQPEATATAEEKPEIEILTTSETVDEIARTIHVKVRNNTDHLIEYMDLKGVYYNKQKGIVGTGIGNVTNIAAGASKTIDIMAMGIENAESYEVEMGNVMD